MDIPPNQTVYISNLYEKLNKDGEHTGKAALADQNLTEKRIAHVNL